MNYILASDKLGPMIFKRKSSNINTPGKHFIIQLYRNLLLGSKGIDLPQIAQKLEAISSKRTFEPLDPIADNDVQSFLKNEVENCILACIDDVHKKVSLFLKQI